YELPVTTGHFGLVVGSTALGVTWPSVVGWMGWLEGRGAPPAAAIDVRAAAAAADDQGHEADDEPDDEADDDDTDRGGGPTGPDLELAGALVDKPARVVVDRLSELSVDLGDYLDSARYQLPRLARLRHLQDDSRISFSKTLADQAREIGDRTFFLFRGRAFSY